MPRGTEIPAIRLADIRCAIDYISSHPQVDENRIGAVGICAGGGYAICAAQSDHRIRAVAGVSPVDIGGLTRRDIPFEERMKLLDEIGRQRTREFKGEPVRYGTFAPESPETITDATPTLYREAYDYYRTPRGGHPNSTNRFPFTNMASWMAFHAFTHIDTISPRPLLLIAGSKADTIEFSEKAFCKAQDPKELFRIPHATHVDLYDKPEYVTPAVARLAAFFRDALGKSA
ncbi:MAG: alpha/beta hydrolase [Methanomicrobiales archaeon]|nr:alpha/beta hydrolase [Methanomicrobiales archaeon]